MMSKRLIDFKVQFKCHEIHPINSADLGEMIRIGLAVMQSDPSAKNKIILSDGVEKIETAGRGWDIWRPHGSTGSANK